MPIEITRKELYEQLWARPMIKVAADYGLSDVGLKKICKKHRIPVPGCGYWAKKAAGKPVKQKHFSSADDPLIERVVIRGGPEQRLSDGIKAIAKAAKEREKKPENTVEVNPAPERFHTRVRRSIRDLKRAEPSERGLVEAFDTGTFDIEVGPESIDRVAAFLNALVLAAEDRGYAFVNGEQFLEFRVEDEQIGFRVEEQTRRIKHEPTEDEVREIREWEEERRRTYGHLRGSNSWDTFLRFGRPRIPEWDIVPTGKLQVLIDANRYCHDRPRRMYADGKKQRIETLINPILVGLETWAAAIKEQRIKEERREREYKERMRRLEEERRRQALEGKREEALLSDLEEWNRRERVLHYIAAVEAKLELGVCSDPEASREWVDWAKQYAERIDPLGGDRVPKLLQLDDIHPGNWHGS